ncbi:MAG TPA: TonB family protein [Flavipsychrobacter sp.]|nr:TonB family protein [Flavipsychrobacter sp.]
MDAKALSQADYLDILFDNRNKKYGSYELRKHYDNRAAKALFTVMSICIALGGYALMHKEETVAVIATIANKPIEVHTLNIELPKPKIEQPAPVTAAVKPTVANPIAKIVPDEKVIDPHKTVDEMKGKESGLVDAEGSKDGTVVATSKNTNTTGGGTETSTEPNKILTYSEVLPSFNGDLIAYLQKNLQYPSFAKENNIEGRVTVQFVVNEDGSIGNAIIKKGIGGGCNEEAIRVVMNMPKWKPGMQNGRPVKVYYTLPITFMLQ